MSPAHKEHYSILRDAPDIFDKTTFFNSSDIEINTIFYEISGVCNAKCRYCPTGSGVTRERASRFIPPEEFSCGLNRLYELSLLNNDTFFGLFNWGDPLLHPQLDEILTVLNEAGQSFALSTNGSVVPKKLTSSLLDNLSSIRLSLPGFSQKSYNKIHQLNFEKVLHNIDLLNELIPPNTLEVFLFAYKFNFEELFKAAEYFNSKNIQFQIAMPHLTDFDESVSYLADTIDPVKKQKIEEDLFTDYIKPLLLERDNKNFCPKLQNELVIDEYNNILTCCVLSKNSEYYSVGSLFELTKEEIFDLKTRGQPVCRQCFSLGVPYWYIQSHKNLPKVLLTFNTLTYCYVNTGRGFSEKQKVSSNIYPKTSETPFHIYFDLRSFFGIESLRWNPVEDQFCSVKFDEIKVEMKNGEVRFIEPARLVTTGDRISDNEFRFNTNAVWFIIPAEGTMKGITISGSWKVMDIVETLLHRNAFLNIQSQQQDLQIMALSNELSGIKQSVVWQLLMRYHHGFVEKVIPRNTHRRNLYDLGLNGCRILVTKGPRSLYWHYNERKRGQKDESLLQTKSYYNKIRHYTEIFSNAGVNQVDFPKSSGEIEVSVIIPVHNNIQYTLNCLMSISKNTTGSFEVVIIDDASGDETESQLKKIANITLIRNKENLGFVESCNTGAKQSKGKFLLFLNNDTIVTEDWLSPLVEIIKRENVGAVGSKLIFPDGKLQEAGAITWNDASAMNYGRGDNPEKPEYGFVRDVDYCSGAALIVRRDLFEKLGGFDVQFKPGYYEDADLCFSIRNLGYRVLYQPRSVVIHFEGMTSGTDHNAGMKKFQGINKQKFLRKWSGVLTREYYKPDSRNLFSARIRRSGKNILVIDHYVPRYDQDAGSLRMSHLLRILVELGHKVIFIGDNPAKLEPYTTELQQSGVEILYYPYIRSIKEYLADKGNFFDIVILSRAHVASKYIFPARKYCSNARIIFDTVDLQFLRHSRRAEVEGDNNMLFEAEKLKQLELQLARLSDVTLVVSPMEKEILHKENPSLQVSVVSTIHKVHECRNPFSERKGILFLGNFIHMPNVDGVMWFIREIFPLIKEKIPDMVFYIVGIEPPEELRSLNSQDIIITGYVEDLSPYFNCCRISVSPLRYGAGVKGKINQSMSYGVPVVTTSIGAEGLGITDNENILIADDPDTFSRKVIQLYEDEQLWNKISKNSIEHITRNFSYEQSKNRIQGFINSLEKR